MNPSHTGCLVRMCLAACAALSLGQAQAAITCNVSSSGFSSSYDPTAALANSNPASITMTCTRSATGDATSQAYTIQANDGQNNAVQQNRAASGSNRLLYEIYTNGGCTTQWRTANRLVGNITFTSTSDFIPRSQTVPYWGCIAARQAQPGGTYTDTVTITPSVGTAATFPVNISTLAMCSITTPPANLAFTYTAFQASTVIRSTSFSAICTNALPYTLALDATNGVLLGLAYTLSLSATSATGTGAAQSYTVNGSMPGLQSGACGTASCAASQSRVLTITY